MPGSQHSHQDDPARSSRGTRERPVPGQRSSSPIRTAADSELAAEARRRHFGALLKSSPQGIVILDTDGCIREWNPAAVDLLGWPREEMLGSPVRQRLTADEQGSFDEIWTMLLEHREARSVHADGVHRDGRHVPVEIYLAPIQDTDGSFAGVVATLARRDVAAEARTGRQPGHASSAEDRTRPPTPLELDDLTGLPGRRWLQRRLAEPVAPGQTRAAAVLDVDGFALVNQDFGPDAADDVLRELAARLPPLCGGSSVGRWQADEFVVVLDHADAAGLLSAQVDAVLEAARQPFHLPDGPLQLSVSAGCADAPRIAPAQLFNSASAAMGVAKGRGRNRSVWFEGEAPTAAGVSGLRMADDLRRGLAAGEMRLHFQPILELATNDVVGVEALVRWQRPGVGLLQPAAFIELAERTGQIVALGDWVIRQACQAAVELHGARLAPLQVSINVSARQLSDPGLLESLEQAMRTTGCAPSHLAVEVTETALLHDLGAATAVLEAVQALGIDLDLDDFGIGYSSLLYLKHFPVSRIKIDRSFVSGLGTDVADTTIVASTIALAHSFGLTAIAEGVETPRQLTLLRQMGCDYAQGYLLCHPLPHDELTTWLAQQTPSRLLLRTSDHDASTTDPFAPFDAVRKHGAVLWSGADTAQQQDDARRRGADARDQAGDARDQAGDARDQAGDLRDDAADRRDQLADQRDDAADRRDDDASSQQALSPSPVDEAAVTAGRAQSASAREEAASDRSHATRDRELGAEERLQATQDRDGALVDRLAVPAQRPRTDVVPEGRATSHDALTGARLLGAGIRALQHDVDVARMSGSDLTVVHVQVTSPGGAEGSQLNEDALMVVLANALGQCLRESDLLIRSDVREFLCALPGVDLDDAVERLAPLHAALAGPPRFGIATLGFASLTGDEAVDVLVARARGDQPVG